MARQRVGRLTAGTVFFSVVALLAAGVGASTGSAEPPPTVTCGSVITQDTTLTRDLEDCTDGLEVAGTGITLDLGGHTISGTGTAGIGVHITGDEVTIENGKITNFGTGVSSGVFLQLGPISHLRRLKAVENGAGVAAFSSNPFATAPSTIEASEIGRNTGSGMFFDGIYLIVTDSAFRRNGLVGIDQGEAAAVYERNNISNNGGNGIQTLTPYSMSLIGNTLNGNERVRGSTRSRIALILTRSPTSRTTRRTETRSWGSASSTEAPFR